MLLLTLLPPRWLARIWPLALLAPLRAWLRRGSVRVDGGVGSGLRLLLEALPATHAQAGLLPRGLLEPPVQEALRRLLAPGRVFYDVGANVGFFSLVGARLCAPGGSVVAFEPVPASAATARANAALNGLGNVTVLECAAGRTSGRAMLAVPDDTSWARLAGAGAGGAFEVQQVAIDDVVESGASPPPQVVKIDVEGAELEVVRGLERTLAAHSPALVCELHGTAAEFAALLDDLGYGLENLDGPSPVAEATGEVKALALPRER